MFSTRSSITYLCLVYECELHVQMLGREETGEERGGGCGELSAPRYTKAGQNILENIYCTWSDISLRKVASSSWSTQHIFHFYSESLVPFCCPFILFSSISSLSTLLIRRPIYNHFSDHYSLSFTVFLSRTLLFISVLQPFVFWFFVPETC